MEIFVTFAALLGSCALALSVSRIALAALFAALTHTNAGPRGARREQFSVAAGEAKLLAR